MGDPEWGIYLLLWVTKSDAILGYSLMRVKRSSGLKVGKGILKQPLKWMDGTMEQKLESDQKYSVRGYYIGSYCTGSKRFEPLCSCFFKGAVKYFRRVMLLS